jgi:hypothetical protein
MDESEKSPAAARRPRQDLVPPARGRRPVVAAVPGCGGGLLAAVCLPLVYCAGFLRILRGVRMFVFINSNIFGN